MCASCPRANSAQPSVWSHAAVIASRPSLTEIRRPAASVRGAARGAVPLLQWRHRRSLCLQHASRRRCLCDPLMGAQARRATSDGSLGKKKSLTGRSGRPAALLPCWKCRMEHLASGMRQVGTGWAWGAVGRWIHLRIDAFSRRGTAWGGGSGPGHSAQTRETRASPACRAGGLPRVI